MRNLLILASISLVSCTSNATLNPESSNSKSVDSHAQTPDDKTPPDTTPDPQSKKPAEGKGVDIPANISGAFLYCSLDLNSPAGASLTAANCLLQDEQGKKVDPASIADSVKYTAVAPTHIQWTIPNNVQADFDTTFYYNAGSKEESLRGANDSTLIVDFTGLKNGQGNGRLTTSIPQALIAHGPWSKYCDKGQCADMLTATGTLWSKDLGSTMTWDTAKTRCKNLNPVDPNFWRLPGKDETDLLNPTARPTLNARLNLIDNAEYWQAEFESATNQAWTVNVGKSDATIFLLNQFNVNTSLRAICMH